MKLKTSEAAATVFTIACVLLVVGLLGYGFWNDYQERHDDCRDRGGQYVNAGRYGDDMCVKDGVIVRIYK